MKPTIALKGLISLLFAVFFAMTGYATHISGGEISYKHLATDTYEITVDVYYNCDRLGIIGPPSATAVNNNSRIFSSCGTSLSRSFDSKGFVEVSQLCDSSLSQSSCGSGSLPGLRKYTFVDTVVLAPRCTSWTIRYNSVNRDGSDNVFQATTRSLYIDCQLDNVVDSSNSSPVFNADPTPYFCGGTASTYNFNVSDPDGDSVSLNLVAGRALIGASVVSLQYTGIPNNPHNTNFSGANPLPNLNFSASTGSVTFTPPTPPAFPANSSYSYVVVLEAKDYDSAGNLKSTTRRDMKFEVIRCSGNTIPQPILGGVSNVSGGTRVDSNTVRVIEGDSITFDFAFVDSGDSIELSSIVNQTVGATFTSAKDLDTTTATIGWRPSTTSGSPFSFSIDAIDDNCPVSGRNSATLKIEVVDTVNATNYTEIKQSCNNIADGQLTANFTGGIGPFGFRWLKNGVLDPSLTTQTITGISSGDSYSVTVIDSFNNTQSSLGSTNIAQTNPITVAADTVFDIGCNQGCSGEVDISSVVGGTPTVAGPSGYIYSWSGISDTTSNPTNLCAGRYFVTVSDQNGCDTVYRYYVNGPADFTAFISDSLDILCKGDSTGQATVSIDITSCGITDDLCDSTSIDTLGTGAVTNGSNVFPAPYGGRRKAKQQYLYRASELSSAGIPADIKISSLSFLISQDRFIGDIDNFEINLGCTNLDSLPSDTFITGLFNVFDSAGLSIPLGTFTPTWKTHEFQNAFVWDGSSNLVVEVCWNNNPSSNFLVNSEIRSTNTSYRSSTYYESNTGNACLADSITGSANRRPNMRFGFCQPEVTYAWSSGGSDSTETNLWSATHTVTVTNEESCADTVSIFIDEPDSFLVASVASKQNVLCAGDSTGTARISVSGGTVPFNFSWPAGVSTPVHDSIATGLTSGVTYIVTVTDANNCEDTAVVELEELSDLRVAITDSVTINCFGDANGQLFATPDSGITPYTYSWSKLPSGAVSTGATDSIAINLDAGTYRIVVTDSAGCEDSTEASLSDPLQLTSTFTDSTTVQCNGDSSGSLTITPSGGTPGYTYIWARANGTVTTGTSDSIAINLPSDTVGVIITDSRGCRDTNARIMSEPSPVTAIFTDSTSITCVGDTNGTLTITPSGGTPGYTYNWNPAVTVGASDSIATGLSGGVVYRVTVSDNNSCTYVDSASLDIPTGGVSVNFTDSTSISCTFFSDGQLIATPSGGTPNYTYSWIKLGGGNVTTGATDSIAILLNAATYRVVVTDANGCRDSADATLSDPPALSSSMVDSSTVSCFGDTTGSLTVEANGGTPGYTFTWTPAVTTGANDSIAINLSGGTQYQVVVTDVNGCTDTSRQTLSEPQDINSTFTDSTSVSCSGVSDGSVTVTPSGGTPGYTFTWSPAVTTGSSDSIATGLSGNTNYQVVIEDANGCTDTNNISLQDPLTITSVFTDSTTLTCPGDTNGSFTITPSGGTPNYTYSWSASDGSTVATGASDSIAINLTSGVTYSVVITDASGCTDTNSISLTGASGGVSVSFTDSTSVSCTFFSDGQLIATPSGGTPNYTYAWSKLGGGNVSTGATDSIAILLNASTYRVVVTDANGCRDSADATLSDPPALSSSMVDSSTVSCFGDTTGSLTLDANGGTPGYTFTWTPAVTTGANDSIAINLSGGTQYQVVVTDSRGCTDTSRQTLSEPQDLTSSFTDSTSVSCTALGSATVTPNGGTPRYTFTWSPAVTTGASDSIATGLNGSTNYQVVIQDVNGCTDTNNISLQDPVRPTAQFTDSTGISCPGDTNASLTVTPTGGLAPYTFTWTPAVSTGSSDSIAINLTSGVLYTVVVSDSLGCSDTISRTISAPSAVVASIFDSLRISCFGDTNARLFAQAINGTGPYSFNWLRVGSAAPVDTGVSDSIAINLGADTYRVIVTDANGCQDSSDKQLLDPLVLSASFTDSTALSCSGPSNNGSLTVTPTGGTSPYTFSWTPAVSTGTSDSIAIGLSAGILYSVQVSDSNGCSVSISDSLSDPNNFAASFTSSTNPTCNGASDGELIVTPNQGTAPFNYSWSSGTAGSNDSIRTGLQGGVAIFVTVTDASGCRDTVNTILTDPLAITSFFSDSTAIICGGDSTGSLTITPSNGQQPYTFNWTAGVATGASDSIAIGLAGNFSYSVTITDANNCADTNSYTLNEPPAYNLVFSDSTTLACNGDTNGSLTVTPSPGGAYTYAWSASDGSTVTTGATDSIAINLRGGITYTVTITDAFGCQKFVSQSLSEPGSLSLSTSSTPARCGGNQGTASVLASGGTSPYTYAWDSAGTALGQTGATATGLFSGLYNVVVTDTNGCSATASNVAVNDFGAPQVSLDSIFDASCEGVCDGEIYVSIRSFNGPLVSTIWSNGDTTPDITGLCDTTYTLQVEDTAGCQAFFTDTIDNSGSLSLSFNVKPLSCLLTVCDAEVKVTPSGGNMPYTYNWSTSVNDTLDSIVNLCANTYTTTVTDANGCQAIDSATVVNPVQITATSSADSVQCNGQSNGVARINVLTGNAPFTYNWSSSVNDTLDSISGVSAGTYFVTVTSLDGCNFFDTITVEQPLAISASFSTVPADCGLANGQVTASTSGGNGSYSYQWPVGGLTTNSTDTGYAANTYNVTIFDQKGCSQILPFTIGNVGGPVISLDSVNNETCVSDCDGGIFVSVSAGNPNYLYQWTPGSASSQDLDSVCPGAYTLRVTDQLGCVSFFTDTIDGATPINANASLVSNASAPTNCDGAASASPGGGTPPYTYSWTSGSTGSSANNLCVGQNFVTVTDSLGCSVIDTVLISAPVSIVIDSFNVSNATCNAVPCDGEVFVLASGGSGPLTYIWNNGDIGQTTSGRCPGVATVTITDGSDTLVQNYPISNVGGPLVSTGKVDLSCNGSGDGIAFASATGTVTYNWPAIPSTNDSITGLSAGTYEVRVTDSVGCVSVDTVIVNQPNQLSASFSSVQPGCLLSNGQITASVGGGTPGYTYLWLDTALNPLTPSQTGATATNLSAGIYNLQVTDTNSCSRIFNVTLSNAGGPVITLDSLVDVSCNGQCDGGIFLTVSGSGLNFLWSSGETSEDITNKCAGPYQMGVVDNNFCLSFFTDTIDEPNLLTLSHTVISNATAAGQCDGIASVQASGGTPNYSYSWPTGVSTNAAGDTATGLCANTYVVTVTDANNCSTTDTVVITEPLPITIDSTNSSDPACGVTPCNGTAFVLASGGVGSLTYTWSNGDNGQTSSSLCPGFYTVSVSDGVDTVTQTYLLSNPGAPNISMSKVDVSCNGSADGLGIVSSTTSNVTFLWPAVPSTNDTVTGLSQGTYEARVIDTAGCISVDTIVINEPGAISASFITIDPNCSANDGQIIASVSGGTANYNYNWLDNSLAALIPSQTTDTANNLGAGIYNLAIEDANGCQDTSRNITLSNLNAALISLDSLNDESCPAACDGDIFVSTSGGTGSLIYSWTSGSTSQDLLNQCPNPYTLQVTDSLGCISFFTDTIEAASPISKTVSLVSNVSSISTCDGQASVLASGGAGNYSYQWTGGSTSPNANNLCVGTNYVTVTDQNGCSVVDSIIMANPTVLRLDTSLITNPSCNVCNGEIAVVISGGVAPYTYTWDNGDNTDTTRNRCAGIIRLSVRDVNGLTQIFTFNLSNTPAPSISLNADSTSCFGSCDGRAYVNVLNALPPFTVNWVGLGASSDTVDNLCAGVYGVEVTDVVGCIATDTVEVKSPAEIIARFNITEPNCQSGDGSVQTQVVTVGGKAPYSYEWLDGAQNPFIPPETTDSLTNITAGSYFVNITDADNCTKQEVVNISNVGSPVVLLDTLKDETCRGLCDGEIAITAVGRGNLIYSWNSGAFTTDDISGLCEGRYTVEVTDSANCKSFTSFNISPADTFDLNLAATTDASCESTNDGEVDIEVFGPSAPFTYNWSGPGGFSAGVQDVSGLIQGEYKVTVLDVNGCEDSLTANIGVATNLEVIAPEDTSVCGTPGSIFLRATSISNASVNYRWFDDLGFVLGNSDLLRLVPEGGARQYVVEATAGLCIDYDTISVSVVPYVRADAGEDKVITIGDEVVIGGNPTAIAGETVQWSPADYFVGQTDEYNPIVKPDEDITYVVEVTTAFGCSATDTMNIEVESVKLVDGFTPNDDGVNDVWRPTDLSEYPNVEVEVYNRWGQLVFQSTGYSVPWDGTYKGQDLPVGTYYYVIDFNDDSLEERVVTGPVTIMR